MSPPPRLLPKDSRKMSTIVVTPQVCQCKVGLIWLCIRSLLTVFHTLGGWTGLEVEMDGGRFVGGGRGSDLHGEGPVGGLGRGSGEGCNMWGVSDGGEGSGMDEGQGGGERGGGQRELGGMEMGGGESGGVGGGCHGLEGMAMGRDAQGGLESPWGGAGGGASEAGVVEGEGGGGSGGRGSGGGGAGREGPACGCSLSHRALAREWDRRPSGPQSCSRSMRLSRYVRPFSSTTLLSPQVFK